MSTRFQIVLKELKKIYKERTVLDIGERRKIFPSDFLSCSFSLSR